jgi:hypothetical protein
MATLKNPSIYEDRSTIGSVDEFDEYGVWVKFEPEELSDADVNNFPGFDADFGPEGSLTEGSEEGADFEAFSYSGEGEDINFDDVEALRQDIESFPPVGPANDASFGSDAVESAAFEPPMTEPAAVGPVAANPAPASEAPPGDLSTRLLMKIADELSSIKDELSTLKGELSAFRFEKPGGGNAEDTGFLGEEDDDKIALTGDELNNIIHTADFTEETGFDAGDSLADDFALPDTPADSGAPPFADGEEPIYDSVAAPLELKKPRDLKTLQEQGVDPMTPQPEDTSYLEEDPLAEDSLDLSDAVIEEPDLSEGIQDTPLEEPLLDNLSLIDLENIAPAAKGEERVAEKTAGEEPSFEDITFEDLPDPQEFSFPESAIESTEIANPEEGEIDLSVLEDDFLAGNDDGVGDTENAGELSFEALDQDTDLPVRENVQGSLIAEDPLEPIILDDDGHIDELRIDEDLEQTLPDDMKIELDLPSLEIDELAQDTEADDDKNFDLPGSADTADAGEPPAIATAEVPPAIKTELRDVLVYMDKLLESLPEEKINEFAQSEHYNTYKKLFEELGIQQ